MSEQSREPGDEVRAAWDANAAFWDRRMGDDGAGTWQGELIAPAVDALLGDVAGRHILELACGNGQYARHLARRGATVVGCDLSPALIEHARRRSGDQGAGVQFRVLDATDVAAIRGLAGDRFDAAVCNMAVMDMPAIEPMFAGVADVLGTGSVFVIATLHPCFNTSAPTLVEEQVEELSTGLRIEYSLKLSRYKSSFQWRGEAISGQPVLQPYFHRPLEEILGAGFGAGFVVDGLAEPTLPWPPKPQAQLSWDRLQDIPPIMVVRFRRR